MPDPQGTWISPALTFWERQSTLPLNERARAFELESSAQKITVLTLRRNVAAARYCARHAKSVGLRLEDVKAAILAVELLMRFERRDRAKANEIRKSVLEGRVSVRRMRGYLKYIPEKRSRGRAMNEWGDFALALIEQCYPHEITSFAAGGNSSIGKILKVDIEVCIAEQKEPHAIFISPLDSYSESSGSTIDDQIPLLLAATLKYPRVNVVLHDPDEVRRIEAVLNMISKPMSGDLYLVRLFETSPEAE